jgi:hypothetical protein
MRCRAEMKKVNLVYNIFISEIHKICVRLFFKGIKKKGDRLATLFIFGLFSFGIFNVLNFFTNILS